MNIKYYDLYYTVIKNRDERDEEEEYDKIYHIILNHFVTKKNEDELLLT